MQKRDLLNFLEKIYAAVFLFGLFIFGFISSAAVDCSSLGSYHEENGICLPDVDLVEDEIPDIIVTVIEYAIYLVGFVSIIFIIFAGYKYVTSGGEKNDIDEAKNTIKNSLIGLAVSLLAYVLVNTVIEVLGS